VTVNRYPGYCTACGKQVEAEQGRLTRDGLKCAEHAFSSGMRPNTYSENLARKIRRQDADAAHYVLANQRLAALAAFRIMFLLPRG